MSAGALWGAFALLLVSTWCDASKDSLGRGGNSGGVTTEFEATALLERCSCDTDADSIPAFLVKASSAFCRASSIRDKVRGGRGGLDDPASAVDRPGISRGDSPSGLAMFDWTCCCGGFAHAGRKQSETCCTLAKQKSYRRDHLYVNCTASFLR